MEGWNFMVKNKLKSMLIIYNELPYPLTFGGNIRVFHLLKELSKYYNVTLLTLLNKRNYLVSSKLKKFCNVIIAPCFVEEFLSKPSFIFYFFKSLYLKFERLFSPFKPRLSKNYNYQIFCLKKELKNILSKREFDYIQVEHSYLAPVLDNINTKAKKIIDFHNIHSYMTKKNRLLKIIRNDEIEMSKNYDIALFCSKIEQVRAKDYGYKDIKVVPNGVDTEYFKPARIDKKPSSLLFVGNLNYKPNIEAIKYFLGEIYPLLKSNLKVNFVGEYNKRRFKDKKNVYFHGHIKDIRPFFSEAIFICPILQGGGTRIKILTAFAAGCPVISTKKGAEGIEYTNNKNIIITENSLKFARQIDKLANDFKLYKRIKTNARKLAENKYDWVNIVNNYNVFLKKVGK